MSIHLLPKPANAAMAVDPAGSRRLFWKAYLAWLASASIEDANQLEDVLTQFAHHVRPLVEAVSDALRSPPDAPKLPQSLVIQLACAGWQPARQDHASMAAA